jgi:hypothetical protein
MSDKRSSSNRRSTGKEKALAALLLSGNIRQASKAASLSEKTLSRYLQDPEFRETYRAARRGTVEAAIAETQQLMSTAVDTLRRNLTCGRPSVEIRAARIILEQGISGLETVDLLSRVERLEDEFSRLENKEA